MSILQVRREGEEVQVNQKSPFYKSPVHRFRRRSGILVPRVESLGFATNGCWLAKLPGGQNHIDAPVQPCRPCGDASAGGLSLLAVYLGPMRTSAPPHSTPDAQPSRGIAPPREPCERTSETTDSILRGRLHDLHALHDLDSGVVGRHATQWVESEITSRPCPWEPASVQGEAVNYATSITAICAKLACDWHQMVKIPRTWFPIAMNNLELFGCHPRMNSPSILGSQS